MLERALLIATVAGGAALGFLWPADTARTTGSDDSVEVTLQRSPDRHFYAEAEVNGKPVRFLVDTGAGELALTEEDAARAGVRVDPDKYELLGHGASGLVRGQYVELRQVDVGGIRESGTKAVVVQGANMSLLGQPFLETIDEIVIRKDEMVLRDRKAA